MSGQSRITLAAGKALGVASETENNAPINFERVYLESRAVKARGALATESLAKYLRNASNLEMDVDGSSVVVPFIYQVPAGFHVAITELVVTIAQAGIDSAWSQFGGLAALTNGLLAVVDDGGVVPTTLLDLTDGSPWKRTADLLALSNMSTMVASTAGVDAITIRMRMGDGLYLTAGHRLVVTVRDNLTTLDAFRVMALGVIRSAAAV